MTTTLAPPWTRGRHIEALLALDPDEPSAMAPNFTPAPATQSPGSDWPPDQWD